MGTLLEDQYKYLAYFFDILLTVHLNIFILILTNLMHKILYLVYFTPLHVSSTCAHRQAVKIV